MLDSAAIFFHNTLMCDEIVTDNPKLLSGVPAEEVKDGHSPTTNGEEDEFNIESDLKEILRKTRNFGRLIEFGEEMENQKFMNK